MNDYDTNESSGSESEAYDSFDDESCKEESRENLIPDSPKALQIVVKRVGNGEGDFLTLEVDPGASVLDLKNLISAELAAKNDRVPIDRQRLVYFGRMLRDNNELLLGKGIKMQAESINYVHLSPLPEGAKPSKRSNASPTSGEQDLTESLESRLERARRLGAAARERRRRRRAAPYESARRRRGGEEAQTSASQPQEEPGLFAFTTASDLLHVPLSSSQVFTLPVRHAAPPVFSSLQSLSPLVQMSHLSATVAAASRGARAATSLANSHLMEQVRRTSTDLVPSMALLGSQLRRLGASHILDFSGDHNVYETLSVLDRVSQDTSALAVALRTMAETSPYSPTPFAITPAIPHTAASPVTLDQLFAENDNSRAALFPDGSPVFLPGPWVTRML
jgi:hypothetical protein